MVNQRPPPELARARHWEIRRRYSRKLKVGKRSRPMASIRIAELGRWLADVAGAGAELEPCQWSEGIARIFVHHFVVLADGNRRAAQWLESYCPWISTPDREYMISEANHCPLKWSADKLGWKLRLTDAKRTELKITTIGTIDLTKDQRAARRKARNAEANRRRRATRKAANDNSEHSI